MGGLGLGAFAAWTLARLANKLTTVLDAAEKYFRAQLEFIDKTPKHQAQLEDDMRRGVAAVERIERGMNGVPRTMAEVHSPFPPG